MLVKLTDQFIRSIIDGKIEIKQKSYITHFRKQVGDNGRGTPQRYLPAMLRGKPVDKKYVLALIGYLKSMRPLPKGTIFVEAIRTMSGMPDPGWESFSPMLRLMTSAKDTDELHVNDLQVDLKKCCYEIIHTVGLYMANDLDDIGEAACIERGQKAFTKTIEQMESWLMPIASMCDYVLMYAVHNDTTVSICLTLPLSEVAYNRFVNGELIDTDITPDDIEFPTPYLLLVYLSQPPVTHDGISLIQINHAQIKTSAIQGSYLSLGYKPHFATMGGTKLYVERLEKLGFKNTGKTMPNTSMDIYRFEPAFNNDSNAYVWLCQCYDAVRLVNSSLWA